MMKILRNRISKGVYYAVGYVIIKWLIILSAGKYLLQLGLWKNEYLLALPALGLATGLFHYFRKEPSFRRYLRKSLEKYYPRAADQLMEDVETRYQKLKNDVGFARTSANPMDKRLELSAYFLALIMVLEKTGENFTAIREIAMYTVTEYLRPKNRLQMYLKKLPVILIQTSLGRYLIKIFAGKVGRRGNPDGFVARIITDKAQTYGLGYGVDILECSICKLFDKYNYQKYVPILCEIDRYTTSLAGLTMIRTDTIANGAAVCDFRYKLKA